MGLACLRRCLTFPHISAGVLQHAPASCMCASQLTMFCAPAGGAAGACSATAQHRSCSCWCSALHALVSRAGCYKQQSGGRVVRGTSAAAVCGAQGTETEKLCSGALLMAALPLGFGLRLLCPPVLALEETTCRGCWGHGIRHIQQHAHWICLSCSAGADCGGYSQSRSARKRPVHSRAEGQAAASFVWGCKCVDALSPARINDAVMQTNGQQAEPCGA